MEKKVNWGVIGLGNIAMEFAKAIKLTSNANLKGISSKTHSKILNYKDLFDIKSDYCFDNYNDLINCNEIQAVYIALPNSMHYEYIIECIKANKKILVEKPVTKNFSEIKLLKDKYNINKFFFCEGFMYMHNPQIISVIKMLEDNIIGNLLSIKSKFGKNILTKKNFFGIKTQKKQDIKSRLFNPDLGGGVILDLGCYTTSFCLLIASIYFDFSIEQIKLEDIKKQIGTTGVEIDASAKINFDNKFKAEIETSFIKDIGSESEIIGDKGSIKIIDTWHGSSYLILNIKNKKKEIIKENFHNNYYYQIKNLSNNILEKMSKPKQPAMDFEKSFINMSILEKWKKNEQ